jgi:hypothetical protein
MISSRFLEAVSAATELIPGGEGRAGWRIVHSLPGSRREHDQVLPCRSRWARIDQNPVAPMPQLQIIPVGFVDLIN